MNTEISKAMNRKEKKHTFRKWWNKNGYKVMRVIFFPIWWGMKINEKLEPYLNRKYEWNEERAQEILDYYIPRSSKWDGEEKSFYFFDNGFGWSMKYWQRKLKLRDRKLWKYNITWDCGKIRDYLINNFELEGFTKEVGDCSDGWTEICFTMIEK